MQIIEHIEALYEHQRIARPSGGIGRQISRLINRGLIIKAEGACADEIATWTEAVETVTASTHTWAR